MAGYGGFARVYDRLTENVPYDEIAGLYCGKIRKFGGGGFLADIGCGTGSLTTRFAAAGFDVIGADSSADMLSEAMNKPHDGVQYICQSMAELDLYGQADIITSTLDSINHLSDADEMERCFKACALNLRQGGLLLFDVNTVYKHKEILADNVFVYDLDDIYCVWQNEFCEDDNGVDITLSIFCEEESGLYSRFEECFRETAVSEGHLRKMLSGCGFEVLEIKEYLTDKLPRADSDKLMVCARKR